MKTVKQRFLERLHLIDTSDTAACWRWVKGNGLLATSYGAVYCSIRKVDFGAHKISWMLHHKRKIPPGMIMCHKCDNPTCVNPHHLFPGTPSDNTRNMLLKKRGRQVLDTASVLEIRDHRGNIPASKLADMYNVTRGTIYNIWYRKLWAHI